MNDYYLKIFLTDEANVLDYLKVSAYLKTHDLVEETHIILDNLVELEDHPQLSSFTLFKNQRRYQELLRRLASFKKSNNED